MNPPVEAPHRDSGAWRPSARYRRRRRARRSVCAPREAQSSGGASTTTIGVSRATLVAGFGDHTVHLDRSGFDELTRLFAERPAAPHQFGIHRFARPFSSTLRKNVVNQHDRLMGVRRPQAPGQLVGRVRAVRSAWRARRGRNPCSQSAAAHRRGQQLTHRAHDSIVADVLDSVIANSRQPTRRDRAAPTVRSRCRRHRRS